MICGDILKEFDPKAKGAISDTDSYVSTREPTIIYILLIPARFLLQATP
jgi:hypothetical protein